MRLERLHVKNFRTLEEFDLAFPQQYTAICGKNDSGKSNILRAIRAVVTVDQDDDPFSDDEEITASRDYPKWKKLDKSSDPLEITTHFQVFKNADAALYSFLVTYLKLDPNSSDVIRLAISRRSTEATPRTLVAFVNGSEIDSLQSQEVHTRLGSSRSILFHNSANANNDWAPGHLFGAVMHSSREDLEDLRKAIERKLKKVALHHQKELTELLGRLEESYRVTVDLPSMDFRYLRYGVALSDKKIEVPLINWGSGTRNRTMILLNLFRARQISESKTSTSKITPMIIIEEPESFLHPSAQSEFSRVLQSLADELQIQVIATTHSPYMLSHANPKANVLLERHLHYNQQRETRHVATSDDNWMEPFSLALGITGEEIQWPVRRGTNSLVDRGLRRARVPISVHARSEMH